MANIKIPKVSRRTILTVMNNFQKKLKQLGKLEAMRQDAFYIEQPTIRNVCLELEKEHNYPLGSLCGLVSIFYKSIKMELKGGTR